MGVSESDLINVVAKWERSIEGIENSYGAFQNPTNITTGLAPLVLHYPPSFETGEEASPHAHFNRWRNNIIIRSTLLVRPRTNMGANLSFLENEAMPFLYKWRSKFQDSSVINDMLRTSPNLTRAFLTGGTYGVGGNLLTIGSTEWIGCVFNFTFTEIG